MSRVIEADGDGALKIPPDLLGSNSAHRQYVVESLGAALLLRPRQTGDRTTSLSPQQLAEDFGRWVSSLPPSPHVPDEALRRENMYE